MPEDRNQTGKPAREPMIQKIIKQKVNELRPDIDWNQVFFKMDSKGKIIGVESSDPDLHNWLRCIYVG